MLVREGQKLRLGWRGGGRSFSGRCWRGGEGVSGYWAGRRFTARVSERKVLLKQGFEVSREEKRDPASDGMLESFGLLEGA